MLNIESILTKTCECLKISLRVTRVNVIKKFVNDEEGQGLTEYALLVFLIGISMMGVMWIFRNEIRHIYEDIIVNGMQNT